MKLYIYYNIYIGVIMALESGGSGWPPVGRGGRHAAVLMAATCLGILVGTYAGRFRGLVGCRWL